ncbi:MAG: hypothetical protein RLZZ124_1800 [Cyanobacteriota bacterium]|jgi:hypothetical protein
MPTMPSFQDLAQKALGALGLGQSTSGESAPLPQPVDAGASWIRFEAHGPQWGFAFWGLTSGDAELLSPGAGALRLRIADVTGLEPGQPPHALQELRVDPRAGQWGVALPLGNRIYRAELGLALAGGWRSLACSAPTHIPGYDQSAATPEAFTPFPAAIEVVPAPMPAAPAPAAAPGLHERLYQSATVRLRRLGTGSEEFQELEGLEDVGLALSDSGLGLWASGRNESGSGFVARQRSFWLVADAELIVYGATDPSATLRIGEEVVPLSADGSFRIQVPFRDGHQLYPIEAISADGEQRRSIVLKFERTTPEDRTNPASAARAEWF